MKSAIKFLIVIFLSAASNMQAQSAPSQSTAPTEIPTPAHPATPDQVREYLSLVDYVGSSHKMMGQLLKASRATSAPYYTPSFWDDMEKALMEIDLITPVIPAYQKYFSQEDMAATIAFYKSPAGKHLLQAQPAIASAAGDILRQAGHAAGEEVGAKHKQEIETLMKQQQQETPAKPSTNQAPPNN